MRVLALLAFSLFLPMSAAEAGLVWTAAGDGISLFAEANWLDCAGLIPGAGTINPNTAITANTGGTVLIDSSAASFPTAVGGANFALGANALTLDGGQLIFNPSIASPGGITAAGTNTTITNGSSLGTQFLVNQTVTVSGASDVTLYGAGNPLASGSTINVLDTGSILNFNNQVFANIDQSELTFQGNALVFGLDPFSIEPGDNAIASSINGGAGASIGFVPEPGSVSFMALALCSGVFYRRKRKC